MKIALLQCNFTVGDLKGNKEKVLRSVLNAKQQGTDLCVTSELALTGYPPRDLLLNPAFIEKTRQNLTVLTKELCDAPPVLLGLPLENAALQGKHLYNVAALLSSGRIEKTFYKALLPTYDVFDEERYFESSSNLSGVLEYKGMRLGVTICEDIWNDNDFWTHPKYHNDPLENLSSVGVDAIVNLSSSPFTLGKQQIREAMMGSLAKKYKIPFLYCNQVGGNDDLVFDGRSCAFNAEGQLMARAVPFREDILIVDLGPGAQNHIADDDFTSESEAWRALVCGTRDYILKCGFKTALLGLSGGIDSALTATIAAEAIGAENVLGVLLPSPYSSQGSIDDTLTLAKNLGIRTIQLPIKAIMSTFNTTLEPAFAGYKKDVTEENIQARIRGNILMALSNKYEAMLLTTGNKSELAVGYCTIYGDMSGGLAVIADVPKTLVYRIAQWFNNTRGAVIPQAIIVKAPSAELRPNQTDQDTLPPYEVLDKMLGRYIEQHQSAEEIVQAGFNPQLVESVLTMVAKAEFKRKQAAPGLKITDRAFGTGWRMPIAAKKLV